MYVQIYVYTYVYIHIYIYLFMATPESRKPHMTCFLCISSMCGTSSHMFDDLGSLPEHILWPIFTWLHARAATVAAALLVG